MEKTPLYREVADRIATLVAGGTFRTGDRLPSIREMSRQAQVSINTVKVAYSHLEDQCLIEARPQSGYYVCPRPLQLPREPKISPRTIGPQEISASKLVVRLMRDTLDSQKVQFGAAIPDPQLIPAQKLGRILAGACRSHASESAGYATSPGHKQLRSQIARWMLKAGCTLNPEDLIITTGASEAVFLALQVLCKPGDTVAIGQYFPAGTRVTRPAGGFSLWLELPGDVDTMVLYDHAQIGKNCRRSGPDFFYRRQISQLPAPQWRSLVGRKPLGRRITWQDGGGAVLGKSLTITLFRLSLYLNC